MQEQIWEAKEDLSVYSDLSMFEFEQIARFIDDPRQVMEIGCGLGRGSIFLNNSLQDSRTLFFLADRTGYTTNTGAFNPTTDEVYNDLVLTEDFCRLNGIVDPETFDTELGDWSTLPKFDLIFSLCSLGMHVPIERYMDRMLSVLSLEGTMIFGTRGPYTQETFADLFEESLFIMGLESDTFPHENWLVLRRKKYD